MQHKTVSVVIVSYNAIDYLVQTLKSVASASVVLQKQNIFTEVIVADNASSDNSVPTIQAQFPDVKIIALQQNIGFARANNEAFKHCCGEYILILNPDTLLANDCILELIRCLEKEPLAGMAGPYILNPDGTYAPESKRALPTPWIAFFKLFGLFAWFAKKIAQIIRKPFAMYHLNPSDNTQVQRVQILSGACMLIRAEILHILKGFDTQFFMYGEDIDLSYRVMQAGYLNYFCPSARIIHYKGRSTPKSNTKYIGIFYKAMWLFARKHTPVSWHLPVLVGIILRAGWDYGINILQRLGLPFYELTLTALWFLGIKYFWAFFYAYSAGGNYPTSFYTIALPLYTLSFGIGFYATGAYKRPFVLGRLLTGTATAFVAIVLLSYLMPTINFSRAIVLLSSLAVFASAAIIRIFINYKAFKIKGLLPKAYRALVMGTYPQMQHIIPRVGAIGYVSETPITGLTDSIWLGPEQKLQEITKALKMTHIFVCEDTQNYNAFINNLSRLGPKVEMVLVPAQTEFGFASQQKILLVHPQYQEWIRAKQNTNRALCLALFILFPFTFFMFREPRKFWLNMKSVWQQQKNWVGYRTPILPQLPSLMPGVIQIPAEPNPAQANIAYATARNPWRDVILLFQNYASLDAA